MSFEGRVSRESHEGGLLVSFEGKAPRLGAKLRIVGGKPLGKVETVLGPADEPLIHLLPLANGIDGSKAIDSPVEIAPRHSRDSSKRRPMNTHRGKKDWSKNSGNSRMKSGDWVCPKCKNHNFANKKVCNRTGCEQPKPKVVGRGRDSRGFRPSKSGGFRDSNKKPGDWVCPKCKNHNFANKKVCNRTGCEQPKPKVVGRGRDSRGFRPSKSGGFRDSNMKPGDWNCPKCKNHNFAKREVCNRCDTRKPVEGKGSRKTKGRQRRPNPRDGWKPRRRG